MQTQTHGGRRLCELVALVQGKVEGLGQPVPKLVVLVPQALVFLEEFVAGGPRLLGVGDGLLDLGGVIVDGLTVTAVVAGLLGDLTMTATENSGGVSDPVEEG